MYHAACKYEYSSIVACKDEYSSIDPEIVELTADLLIRNLKNEPCDSATPMQYSSLLSSNPAIPSRATLATHKFHTS